MEAKKKHYGILMDRIFVKTGIYIYFPKYLIAGELKKEKDGTIFQDSIGNKYFLSSDLRSLDEEKTLTVYPTLSESELRKKYPKKDLLEANYEYFQAISSKVYIGYNLIMDDCIYLEAYDVMAAYDFLQENGYAPALPNSKSDTKTDFYTSAEDYEKSADDEKISPDTIFISKDEFHKLLRMDTYTSLRNKLLEILRQSEDTYNHFDSDEEIENDASIPTFDNSMVTEVQILTFFEDVYREIRNSSKIVTTVKLIMALQVAFKRILNDLIENCQDEKELDVTAEYIFFLLDNLECIVASNDLDCMKEDMMKIHQTESSHIRKLASLYELTMRSTRAKEKLKKAKEKKAVETKSHRELKLINAREMKSFMDRKVIGQEDAKKIVISALISNQLAETKDERTACLLVGPTGSGKTLIAEAVSEHLEIPIEIVDTTQLTDQGYIGNKLENFLLRLLEKANGNLDLAQHGIIVLDELDKKGSEKNSDVSGKAVLNMLLPFIHGTTYNLKYKGKTVLFDTSFLTIYATGAFTDVVKGSLKAKDSYHSTGIGFGANLNKRKNEDILYPTLKPKDFVRYGNMTDEIMGRFTTIAQLSGQTRESLRTILTTAENSALLSEKRKLEKLNVVLYWTEGYIDAVVDSAMELGTGARSLKSTIEQSILHARWEVYMNLGEYCGIVLTAKTVKDNYDCELINQQGISRNLKDILKKREGEQETAIKLDSPKVKELVSGEVKI